MGDMVCNFSIQHYREILETGIENGYKFIGFEEVSGFPPGEKGCILRHDVDYMPEWSIRFGEIENEMGIKSTYFFQVCAKTYNLREARNYRTVHKLIEMGHTVGMHFDPTWKENMHWEEIALFCEEDKAVLRVIADTDPCDIISFHNPHRFVDRIVNQDIPKIRHTYEKRFFSSIQYVSDSQGWYEGCMCELFASRKYGVIQFLAHPDFWPDVTSGNFISDMARLIKWRTDELTQYVVDFHPVCKQYEARLRKEVREIGSSQT